MKMKIYRPNCQKQGKGVQKLIAFLGIVMFSSVSFGQATNASIRGKITDANGESLMGAAIIVKNTSTGFVSGTVTNENGNYRVQQLPLGGPYSITVQYLGFQDSIREGFTLNLSDALVLDFVMQEAPRC